MEIIRHRNTGPHEAIPHEIVDREDMNFMAIGLLNVLLRWSGQDSTTLSALGSRYGAGSKVMTKTMKILRDAGHVAHFRIQHATGPWGCKMVVSALPMTAGDIGTAMDELVGRDDIIGVQLTDHIWKSIPGMSRRKSKSAALSA